MSGHCRLLFASSRIMGFHLLNENCFVFAFVVTKSFADAFTKSVHANPASSSIIITVNERIVIIALLAVVVALSIVLLLYSRHRKTTK